MQLRDACLSILSQLEEVIGQMSDDDFSKPSPSLGNVTIAQHLRHTIEFFLCLEMGFSAGVVNYDKRAHDTLIETDRLLALAAVERIRGFIAKNHDDRPIRLEVGYERHSEATVSVASNYYRELVYNIEHAVHHMALMKVGIREVSPYVILPREFGIAVSTLRYSEANRQT